MWCRIYTSPFDGVGLLAYDVTYALPRNRVGLIKIYREKTFAGRPEMPYMLVYGVGLILEILEMPHRDARSDAQSEFHAFMVHLIGWGFKTSK